MVGQNLAGAIFHIFDPADNSLFVGLALKCFQFIASSDIFGVSAVLTSRP